MTEGFWWAEPDLPDAGDHAGLHDWDPGDHGDPDDHGDHGDHGDHTDHTGAGDLLTGQEPDPLLDEPGGWSPYDGAPDAGAPESLTDVVYGSSGVDGVAHDLWSQLLPGSPVPAGVDGAELHGAELLEELRARVHDPMLASVIDDMLSESRGSA